jgi:NADP-dependent 3-hydroxy acid dehydrogenase YdfG
VFLTGRHISSVQKLAEEIIASGGMAEAAEVDALEEEAIHRHLDAVIQKAGTLDISFNAIGLQDTQNIPLVKMKVADFTRPITIAMQSQFS